MDIYEARPVLSCTTGMQCCKHIIQIGCHFNMLAMLEPQESVTQALAVG